MAGKRLKYLIIIFFIAFVLRLPSLFEPYWYGDENIYLVMGQALRKGLVFYKDIHDNKPPLLYLLAAAAGNVFFFRLILLCWHFLTLYFFYKLAILFFKKLKIASGLTLVFAVFSTLPLLEGNIANSEIFMLLPTLVGFWLLLRKERIKIKDYLLAGLSFSFALLFKVPAGFDFVAAFLFFLVFTQGSFKMLFKKTWWYQVFIFTAGFLIPLVLSLLYYYFKGALADYLHACFFQNINYLSSWRGETHFLQGQGRLIARVGGLVLLTGLLYFKRSHFKKNFLLLPIWLLFSLFAALLSERPYPHYLIQVLPAAILLLGVIFQEKFKEKVFAIFTFCLLLFAFYFYNFYTYPVFPYYQNYLKFISGRENKKDYFNNFDAKTYQTYQVAYYLKTHSLPEETVFIWGDEPGIYALAERLPTGRYMVAYHIVHFNGFAETTRSLKEKLPNIIIKMKYENHPFEELDILLNQFYLKTHTIQEAEIYHKILP